MLTKRWVLALLVSMLPLRAFAQAPANNTFYSVSYVEVKPSARTQAIATLKQYRDATHRDDFNIRLELFEQADRPGHFVIVETWKTAASFDAKASARKQLAELFEPLRTSGWDTRPYKTLSVA